MSEPLVLRRQHGPVLTLTFNRPERLNALTPDLLADLQGALDQAAADPGVRAVVLTGAGDRAFVAGADVKEVARMGALDFRRLSSLIMGTVQKIMTLPKPVVGAVNGHALGGGLSMARACDVVVAVEDARFGQPEIHLGIYGGSFGLHHYVGKARAYELVLLGESITAAEAERIGLINRAVPRSGFRAAVREVLEKLLAKSPLALAHAKAALKASLEHGMQLGGEFQTENVSLLFAGPDQREAVQAFLEKRRPAFAEPAPADW